MTEQHFFQDFLPLRARVIGNSCNTERAKGKNEAITQ